MRDVDDPVTLLRPYLSRADRAALRGAPDLPTALVARGHDGPLHGLRHVLAAHPEVAPSPADLLARIDDLDRAFPGGVPLLLPGAPATLDLPRAAVAGLGAHLLLGSLPPHEALHPEQPFNRLDHALADRLPSTQAKLAAWLCWLRQAGRAPPPGRLRILRRCQAPPTAAQWAACEAPLTPLLVLPGSIEDAQGCLQVDFANRFPGGGVLGRGNVQEELRFSVSPELLATTLLCPALRDDEALVVHGAARFSTIQGYGGGARFAGAFADPTPTRPDGTPRVEVVVLDALPFCDGGDLRRQIHLSARLREAGKAWVGFLPSPEEGATPVATGNWGGGVFGGHLPLKALIQWMAASWHGRPLRYHPFGDPRLGDLEGFAAAARGWTVGRLWAALERVAEGLQGRPVGQGCGLSDGRSLYEAVRDALR